MRLDEHVGNSDLVLQVRPFAAMTRIFVRADIIPRPSVESAVTHARDEVGNEIVAQIVALVGRAPEITGHRMHREANAVSQPAGEYSPISALRIEHEYRRAIGLAAPRGPQTVLRFPACDRGGVALAHPFPVIRCRADRDEHLAAILGESNVTRNVSALHRAAARVGKIAHDHLGFAARLEVAVAIWIADHRAGVGDVYPLRIRSRRIEGYAERLIEA